VRVFVVTPPEPVVSYAEAVARLRLAGGTAEQGDVEGMIAAATSLIDGPGGWLGRAIGAQILEARLDAFTAEMELPFPPVAAIVSVKYIDADGAEQTMGSGDYYLAGRKLMLTPGKSWPSARAQAEAVRIRYDAGYEAIPPNIKSAILLMTGDQYRHRDTAPELSKAAERLLEPLQVWA
jgi:hypothetical protein